MKPNLCTLALVSILALSACGGDDKPSAKASSNEICSEVQGISVKYAACFSDGGDQVADEDQAQALAECVSGLDACTDKGREMTRAFVECVNKIPVCTSAEDTTFFQSYLSCMFANSVGDECPEL